MGTYVAVADSQLGLQFLCLEKPTSQLKYWYSVISAVEEGIVDIFCTLYKAGEDLI
jgi:hypothetical protein